MAENPTVEELKAPLLAAVGAADLALATVNEIVATLRERAEEARTDATTRAEERRAKLTARVDDDPRPAHQAAGGSAQGHRRAAREADRRRAAQGRRGATPRPRRAPTTSWSSAARPPSSGCATSRRIEEAAERAEEYIDQAVELTQDALGTVATQTRAVGERAAKLVGVELPGKVDEAAAPVKEPPPRRPPPRRPRPRRPPRPRRRPWPRRLRPRRSPRSKQSSTQVDAADGTRLGLEL